MAWQENEITTTIRTFTDLIPRNFKLYKEYGDRLVNNSERMRQGNQLSPESKDFFTMLNQLCQFIEIIGRLYSQNFNNVQMESADIFDEALIFIRNHKDLNLNDKALKILPKAQALHEQAERQRQDFERNKKETQDSLQKIKASKNDPYNLSEKVILEEKASRAVKEMEEKKGKYNSTIEQLDLKNKQFIASLEELSKEHQGLIDFTATSVKNFLESCSSTELSHYEGLNLITPDKGQVIKGFISKQDLLIDIKIAEEQGLKIDLSIAKQKISELNEQGANHQAVSPFCQFLTDNSDYFQKIAEKTGKHFACMVQFLGELSASEKNVLKAYKEFNISERQRKENQFGPFQSAAFEFLRTIEMKEKAHQGFSRFLEGMVAKIDTILKAYKADEKMLISQISKIAKDTLANTEKVGKQTSAQEKQLVKISQMLSSNFQGQNEKMTSFQQLMIEYTNITDNLKESYSSYKIYVISQIEGQQEVVKTFKQQQQSVIKALNIVFTSLINQEQSLIDQLFSIQKEFNQFVKLLNAQNFIEEFKCQILNKHSADFQDSSENNENESADHAPVITEIFDENESLRQQNLTQPPDSPLNKSIDGDPGSQEQVFQFSQVELNDRQINQDQSKNNAASIPIEFDEKLFEQGNKEQIQNDQKSRRFSRVDKPYFYQSPSHESFVLRDQNPLDIKAHNSVRNDPLSRHSLMNDQNYRHLSQSVSHQKNDAQDTIINPLKKQLDKLVNKKDDIMSIDENFQREINNLKQNMQQNPLQQSNTQLSQQQQIDDQAENLRKLTVNCKFIQEKFFGLLENETCLESFACAISLKILIQGRLYVTNKRLCFHSYFNDKTIFGKETKILIPYANISRVEKKMNVKVFANSISVFTKDEREIFITSFMFRDQAYELINIQLEKNNGTIDSKSHVNSHEFNSSTEKEGPIGSKENQKNSQFMVLNGSIISAAGPHSQQDDALIEEEVKEEENSPIKIVYDNAEIKVTPEFLKVEQERMEQVKKVIPEILNYSFIGCEDIFECSLKHIFQVFLNHGTKLPTCNNLSLLEWIDATYMSNKDINFTPTAITDAPTYFSKSEEEAPLPESFKSWPLMSNFKQKMLHITEKPKMMQPKQNITNQSVDVIYVSPRMIIRRALFTLDGVPFQENFNFEYKITLQQEEGAGPSFRTKAKSEFRVNIIKPIRFIQGTVVKETENSLRDSYCQGPHREKILEKIHETREYMRQVFNQQQQAIQSQSKAAPKRKSKLEEEQKGQSKENDSSEQHIQSQPSNPQLNQQPIAQQVYNQPAPLIDSSKDIEAITKQLQEMKQLLQKLIYLLVFVVALNMIMIIAFIFK